MSWIRRDYRRSNCSYRTHRHYPYRSAGHIDSSRRIGRRHSTPRRPQHEPDLDLRGCFRCFDGDVFGLVDMRGMIGERRYERMRWVRLGSHDEVVEVNERTGLAEVVWDDIGVGVEEARR